MGQPEHHVLLAIAEVATPPGPELGPIDDTFVTRCRKVVEEAVGGDGWARYCFLLKTLDLAAIATHGSRLSKLPFHEREPALRRLGEARATFWIVRLLLGPIRVARWEGSELHRTLGCGVIERSPLAVVSEPTRWEQQMVDARTLELEEELEVDAVVVGTGAGGGAVAHALARRGHAVVMLEAGGYFSRADFGGSAFARQRKLYYAGATTTTIGNAVIPLPLGRTVGGTTTVNSGTCYRVPASVQRRWELELGLRGLRPGALDPYLDRVEAMLEVAPARPETLAGSARVIARGCEALGYEHGPLSRNAPGCDGQGVCCFGCPTGAKRSTDVSYVPKALERGAMLFHHAEVSEILTDGRRATGVVARATRPDGQRVRLTVRAGAVVLGCGTIHTPLMLLKNGLANSSGQVGRNLTIHPVAYALARFDEPIRGWDGVPQGYAIEEFADQGIRFEGGFVPPEIMVATLTQVGHEWTRLVEDMERLASFGFMIAETSRGRVRPGPKGAPIIRYDLNDTDVQRVIRGLAILARVYLAAGAKEVIPGAQIFDSLRSESDIQRFERDGARHLAAHHFDLTAYHPLGTCRMGADPRTSVVGPTHETHDVERLFICDGSAVPGPLGVNPQVTIMAFSERAAEHIERRIEVAPSPGSIAPRRDMTLEFAETMAGHMISVDPAGDQTRRQVIFHVSASTEADLGASLSKAGSTMRLEGELFFEGLASHVPCTGTLRVRPLRSRATLVYDLAFTADDGRAMALHGEKHVSLTSAREGMTTLYSEVRLEDDEVIAEGVLVFDLDDVGPWLRSLRFMRPEDQGRQQSA